MLAADLLVEDHRPVRIIPTLRTRDEYLPFLRTLVDLAPDVVLRLDHVLAPGVRGNLAVLRWVGSREGGPVEIPMVLVTMLDSAGRIRLWHVYDLDQLDAARARYDELTATPPAPRIENAATRAGDRS